MLARVAFRFKARQGRAGSGEAYHGPKALAGSAVKPHKVNFLFLVRCVCVCVCVCVCQFSLSYLTYIQHATTVFTQPALSGFTIQASIFGSLDTQVSAFCSLVPRPHSTMHYAVCAPFSFNFGFQKKKEKKPGGLVIFQVTFRTRNRKTTLCGLSTSYLWYSLGCSKFSCQSLELL